jgi:hypothetical protein
MDIDAQPIGVLTQRLAADIADAVSRRHGEAAQSDEDRDEPKPDDDTGGHLIGSGR